MKTRHIIIKPLAAAALLALAGTASAAEFKAGDWTLNVGGIVNAFYTHTSCSGDQTIVGAALASEALGCGGTTGRTVIGNGLLPNALVTSAKTQQEGYDIGATLTIGAAVATDSAIADNSAVDVRQGFLTFGNSSMGTIKLGRDYGLFGSNPILSDMTLIGAGAPVAATQRGRVTLGHIGAGYTYLGTYGLMSYSMPTSGGLSLTLALLSPVDAGDLVHTAKNDPQIQAMASYAFTGGKVWAALKSQKFESTVDSGFTMNGAEIGGSYSGDGFSVLANIESGTGLGVLADGDAGDKKQDNLFIQGTFNATPKTKLGVSWGESRLKSGTGTDLHSNSDITLGLYYSLTKSITLSGELSKTESKGYDGSKATLNGISFGGILFF